MPYDEFIRQQIAGDLLAAEGVLVSTLGGRVRMLTHVGVSAADIGTALTAWRRVAAKTGLP